ncbi:MAG: hypothetical protein VKP62_15865, partial [Candidatus Sericytochromatia bacterium]|nr:hypothetical protein [Candidatus Sericytochromatia bacterium]
MSRLAAIRASGWRPRALGLGVAGLMACSAAPEVPIAPAAVSPRPSRSPAVSPSPALSPSPSLAPAPSPVTVTHVTGVVRVPPGVIAPGPVDLSRLGGSVALPRAWRARLSALSLTPLVGAPVQAFTAVGQPLGEPVFTGGDGRYRLEGLPVGGGPFRVRVGIRTGLSGPLVLETVARPGEVLFHDIDPATTLVTSAVLSRAAGALDGVSSRDFDLAALLVRRSLDLAVLEKLAEPQAQLAVVQAIASRELDLAQALATMASPPPSSAPVPLPSALLASPTVVASPTTAPPLPTPTPTAPLPTPRPLLTPWTPATPVPFGGVLGLTRLTRLAGWDVPGFFDGQGEQARFGEPAGMAFDAAGHLYLADRGNHVVRRVTMGGGVVTLAGDGIAGPAAELVEGAEARFDHPAEVAVIDARTLVVADTGNHQLRLVSHLDGTRAQVTVLSGDGLPGYAEGFPPFARLASPGAMAYDGRGSLFVADVGSDTAAARIVRVELSTGFVHPYAGGSNKGVVNGPAAQSRFRYPAGLAVRWRGSIRELWVADREAGNIRRIIDDPAAAGPVVSTAVGPSDAVAEGRDPRVYGWRDTLPFAEVRFKRPGRLAFAPNGDLFVADTESGYVRWLRFDGRDLSEVSTLRPAFVSTGGSQSPFTLPALYGLAV